MIINLFVVTSKRGLQVIFDGKISIFTMKMVWKF